MLLVHDQTFASGFHPVPQTTTACQYRLLAGTVHELKLNAASQNAVREWAHCMEVIFKQGTSQQPIRTLTDARRSLLPPLAYATYLVELRMTQPHYSPFGRNAILHNDAPLNSLAEQVVEALLCADHQVRFFALSQHEAALHWLAGD